MVLSLGPYHHAKPQFRQMEELKDKVLNQFIAWSLAKDQTKNKAFFVGEIMKNINTRRGNYEGVDEYSDEALVDIILRDACFLTYFMPQQQAKFHEICGHLGVPTGVLVRRDLHMLENQIPFWVLKCLLCLSYDKDHADKIVSHYVNEICYQMDDNSLLITLPWNDDGSQPLHLLEAQRSTLLKQDVSKEATVDTKPHFLTKIFKCKRFWKTNNYRMSSTQRFMESINQPCRSVTYLQAKGICFKPSSQCLRDITFTSYYFYAVLHLPILLIDMNTKVLFSNFVAFEMSPKDLTDGGMVSYVNFMKSLIDTSKDVKELRERGILYSTIGNDEEVVKVFREIDTFGMNATDVQKHVRRAINQHCRSKAKTWMADLFHNHFSSPWTVIAVFATTFVLCLTFLQAYYTMHPIN